MEDHTQIIKDVSQPLSQAKGWMKFMAVMLFLGGGGMVLSLWGIVVAWIPIWLGVLLWQAANSAENALRTGRKSMLVESLAKMKLFFIIYGVLMIVAFGGGIVAALIIPRFMLGRF